MYSAHPHVSLKNSGKKVHIIHGKIWYLSGLSLFIFEAGQLKAITPLISVSPQTAYVLVFGKLVFPDPVQPT